MRRDTIERTFLRGCALAILLVLMQDQTFSKDGFRPFTYKTLEGSSKSLKDYLEKATLVTFFFPTCGYCNAEFPYLQKIYEKYKDQGLAMVSINITPDQNSLIPDWWSKHEYTFPVLVVAKQEAVENDYDLNATPTQFLLDSKGKVLMKQTGYRPGDEKVLEERIQRALGQTP